MLEREAVPIRIEAHRIESVVSAAGQGSTGRARQVQEH